MPTPAERKALIFFSIVIALAGGTRLLRSRLQKNPPDPKSLSSLHHQIDAVDSAIAAKHTPRGRGGKRQARRGSPDDPPETASVIDMDTASAAQIETLRGVGPSLAERIVANRDSLGAFGSLDGLKRVRGVGNRLAEKLVNRVTFSGVSRLVNTDAPKRSERHPSAQNPPRHETGKASNGLRNTRRRKQEPLERTRSYH